MEPTTLLKQDIEPNTLPAELFWPQGWAVMKRQSKHRAADGAGMCAVCRPGLFPEQHHSRHLTDRETEQLKERHEGGS